MVVRPDLILDVVREAAASGHRNLLILPGGFAEGGEEGQARDRELRELAQAAWTDHRRAELRGAHRPARSRQPLRRTFFRDCRAAAAWR